MKMKRIGPDVRQISRSSYQQYLSVNASYQANESQRSINNTKFEGCNKDIEDVPSPREVENVQPQIDLRNGPS